MFIMIVVSVVLLLLGSERIQAGKESTCKYPFRTLGDNCYYFSTDKATWDEAYVRITPLEDGILIARRRVETGGGSDTIGFLRCPSLHLPQVNPVVAKLIRSSVYGYTLAINISSLTSIVPLSRDTFVKNKDL
ncbi:uncharacterized protein LOC130054739 [Ostrea edulis]|uniref:uncharacterized protein LOC130054739 n=1 Tax=Ostrea edulis TaxID=37623 RepID=UPI0024AEAEBF|nr:uncharacterized protein LOC130054739 [Ostrea edulis]